MISDNRRELRTFRVLQRCTQRLYSVAIVATALPVLVLNARDSPNHEWGTAVDKAEELVGRIDVLRQ